MKSQTAEAIQKRVNRKLAHDGQRICKTRQSIINRDPNFGEYHEIDVQRNAIIDVDVDLDTRAKELGV
jgi:hypothetical protein